MLEERVGSIRVARQSVLKTIVRKNRLIAFDRECASLENKFIKIFKAMFLKRHIPPIFDMNYV